MRLPSFSRQSDTTAETADRAPVSTRTDAPTQAGAVQADHAATRSDRAADLAASDRAAAERAEASRAGQRDARHDAARAGAGEREARHDAARAGERRAEETRAGEHRTGYLRSDDRTAPMTKVDDRDPDRTERFDTVPADPTPAGRGSASIAASREADRTPVPAGPKPRASLLATLGLITGVAGALLVLSGPLMGYGIGVAVLSLILSVAGLRATKKRHVAGKTDALIGLVLALAAIVVGVLALTGSLSWLGTDMHPVTSVREWLDAQFIDRF
ncbi:thrombospondin [Couchioplanes caeruleus]|uniref:DUF4190 domain-containing protein n=1 Tax=Couchioplanes caeruleus TaxID=56438 RepID=UPI0020BFDA6B|nr:DUF4190 domain-containing protein [Couchioplanes caeruleus]UQU65987.1 thrombospondin [Couchioplanes caeruleus]